MGQRAYKRTGYPNQEIQVIPGDYYIPWQEKSSRKESLSGRNFAGKGQRGNAKNTYSARMLDKNRRERKRRKIKRIILGTGIFLIFAASLPAAGKALLQQKTSEEAERFLEELAAQGSGEAYPEELLEMLEKNQETYDFVAGYPNRSDYIGKEIDISGEFQAGDVPLLMQWDMRWGYDSYGQEMIGVAGCGPTCMTMAYLYLTEDVSMNPRRMAEYAYENGFYTQVGTSWDFFTLGAADLGLSGSELPLGEAQMKNALDEGSVVICSMRPGDFTTTGHFILIRGYDEDGFYVNDPNSRKNSEKQWKFDRLSSQIKCLWRIGK